MSCKRAMTPEHPVVTVLVTAYNAEAYLETALASALKQTFDDFEVIVVDDGSTDGTWQALTRVQSVKVRRLRQEHRGRGAAVNRAAEQARGRFLAFLDADDAWRPQKLERQLEVFEKRPAADLVFTQSEWIGPSGASLGIATRPWNGPLSAEELFRDNVLGNASCAMVRRRAFEAAGGFDPELTSCTDIDCWLRLARLREGNIWGIAEPLTLYRRHGKQITADWRRSQAGWNRLLEKLEEQAPELLRQRSRAVANMRRFWCAVAWESGERFAAARHLAGAVLGSPLEFFTDGRNWRLGYRTLQLFLAGELGKGRLGLK